MSANVFVPFARLLGGAPLQLGDITAVGDGVCTVQLPGGASLTVRGTGTVGQTVFFRAGVIESEAPGGTYVEVDV